MNTSLQRLKDEFDKDPVKTIAVVALAAASAAKLLDAFSARTSRRAYAYNAYTPRSK
jgi:hypothetical protein